MRFVRSMATLLLAGFLMAGFGSVQGQNATSGLDASFTGYIVHPDGSLTLLSQGRACQGDSVKFVANDQKSAHSHYWYLNGVKDPYGSNQTSLRFQLAGVGEYSVQHDVNDARASYGTARLNFMSNDCGSAPTQATTGTSKPNQHPSAQIYVLSQRLCLNEKVEFTGSSSYDDVRVVSWSWRFDGASGSSSAMGTNVVFVATVEGEHQIALSVTDDQGLTGSQSVVYWFYKCSESTGTAYPTAQPSYDARCAELRNEQEKFYADWKFRYNEYANSGRSDPTYEAQLNGERDSFVAGWQRRWTEYGCDGSGGTNDDCARKAAAAQPDFDAIQSRYDRLWAQHWADLEDAKRNYSVDYHTREEWAAFESKWASIADDLSNRQSAEINSVTNKHGLYDCGLYTMRYGPERADYQEVYGTSAPVATTSYDREVSECEVKLYAIRDAYGQRMDVVYKGLASLPEGPGYEEKKRQLLALEQQLSTEMTAVMSVCREEYKDDYQAPESFDETIGGLRCYFNQEVGRVVCHGKYVGFEGHPDTKRIYSYQCGGQFFFDAIYAGADGGDAVRYDETAHVGSTVDESGAAMIAIRSESFKILLHDSPRGVINVGVVTGSELYFVPAGYLRVMANPGKVVLEGAGSRGVFVGAEGALSWDELKRVLTIRGEATWVSETCFADGSKWDGAEDGKYFDAIAARRLGAAVTITFDDTVRQADETYDDDMRVEVKRDAEKKYQAIIDSEDNACKTVVLKFDGSIFDSVNLKVGLTDEDGRTLPMTEADGLEDVLDPCDDGEDGFEYWIVADRLGTQVIVSLVHFSEKRVSVEAASVGNVIVPGLGAEFLVAAVAAGFGLASLARRRLIP